jgi:dinuclear metal center YbgI/SA1388 family protein
LKTKTDDPANESKMTIGEIAKALESWAPRIYQENYDNSGLLLGDIHSEITAAIVSLDCTEAVLDEAIRSGAGLIISHHPIIFGGLKRITGNTQTERVLLKAIRHNIALYAIHTNLDNTFTGVNHKIGDLLKIVNRTVLEPRKASLFKLATFVPMDKTDVVLQALFSAGAGQIGAYSDCSFISEGTGTFKGDVTTNPYVGAAGIRHFENENKVEVILPEHVKNEVIKALIKAHPYEEVAWDLYRLENVYDKLGSGMVGDLVQEKDTLDFLHDLKQIFSVKCIRHTALVNQRIKKVAWCGGSGSFLLPQAIASGADVFISADFTYHKFFDAEGKIIIADIGHFESEQFTIDLIVDFLNKKFPTFATLKTRVNTNPIAYL